MVTVIVASGCAAYKIPERPYDFVNESRIIDLNVRTGNTVEYEHENFESSLRNVDGVRLIDNSTSTRPDYIVANLRPGYDGRCFSEPMLTVLTLGIIPSIGCAPHGYTFELSGGSLPKPVLVDARGDVPLIWGWAALFVLLSGDWVGERGLAEYEAKQLGEAIHRVVNKPEE